MISEVIVVKLYGKILFEDSKQPLPFPFSPSQDQNPFQHLPHINIATGYTELPQHIPENSLCGLVLFYCEYKPCLTRTPSYTSDQPQDRGKNIAILPSHSYSLRPHKTLLIYQRE